MLKAEVRKIERQFLDKFKSLPGLWDPTHPEYCNKYHRMDNLKKLLPILQKLRPNDTVSDVKTRINTFRTNYRKEYNRIKNYISMHPENKDSIKPRLWYFKKLLFLNTIKSKHNPYETNELSGITFADSSNDIDEKNYENSSPTVSTELTNVYSSFKPEPVYFESDETEPRAGPSNVDDEIETETATVEVEDDETEPMRDPTTIMECERNFLIMFRKLPGLWNPADPYYTNRASRHVDLNKLLPFLKKINPKATIVDVRKKINTFRSNYRREHKKIQHSKNIINDPTVTYNPKLWYYKYLSFLNDLEDSKMQEEQNQDEESNEDINYSEHDIHSPTSFNSLRSRKRKPSSEKRKPSQEDNTEDEDATEFLINQEHDHEWQETSLNQKRKVSTQKRNPSQENIEPTAQFLINQEQQQIQNPIVFEWDETLSRLEPKQRLIAKKAINDILYEAELRNLHVGSVKINQPVQTSVCQFDQPSSSSQFDHSSHGRVRVGENIILVKMEGSDPLS